MTGQKKQSTLSSVKVEKMRLRAYIGFSDWEQNKLQDLIISFSFKYDVYEAAKTDDVAFAVNYKSLTKRIVEITENKRFNLIETLAEQIFAEIKKIPQASDVWIKVEKPNALRFCDNVMIEIFDQDRCNTVIIGLGSNINPEENTEKALQALALLGEIGKSTDFIYTKALKFTEQADFLNGAVLLYTKLRYEELKNALRKIESSLKRERGQNKNAPRTIDLDVVVFNSTIVDKDLRDFDFLVGFVKELQPGIMNDE